MLLLAHDDRWLSRVGNVMMHNSRGDVGGPGHDQILVSIIEGVAPSLKDLGGARAEHVRIRAATALLREILDVARLGVRLPNYWCLGTCWGSREDWLHINVTML